MYSEKLSVNNSTKMNGNNCAIIKGSKQKIDYGDKSVGEIFFNALKCNNPEDVIVIDVFGKIQLTRKDFLENSVKLANFLQNIGVRNGDIIGIIGVSNWKLLLAMVSAFYLGATITTSNPNYYEDDLKYFLSSANPKILYVTYNVYNKIQDLLDAYTSVERIIIFDYDGALSFDRLLETYVDIDNFILPEVDPENTLQFILFSSGTSSVPKSVMLSQNNLKNSLSCLQDPDTIDEVDGTIILSVLPLYHIFGLLISITTFLLKEAKLVVMEKFKPDLYLESIQNYNVNFIPVVPTIMIFLARSPLIDQYDLSSLKYIIYGAAPSGKEIEKTVSQRIINSQTRQIYGLTETCGAVTIIPPKKNKPGSIGIPLPSFEIKIVDINTKRLLKRHESGEICVRSPSVMKGYMNTKSDVDDEGWLYTGDMGYVDDDGFVFIVDRIKDVIKYKGFQVAPAQLENILIQHPAVKEVGVVGKHDEIAGELPVAFVVKEAGVNVTEQELIDFVAGHVHRDKQLHGGVVFIDVLPRNETGKILKTQLRSRVNPCSN